MGKYIRCLEIVETAWYVSVCTCIITSQSVTQLLHDDRRNQLAKCKNMHHLSGLPAYTPMTLY